MREWWPLAIVACVVGACSSSGDDTDPNGIAHVEMGAVSSGVAMSLEVPEHTLGFQVILDVDNSAGTENVGIKTIVSPSGEVVMQDYGFPGTYAIGPAPIGTASVAIPQSSAASGMPVEPGTWQVTFTVDGGVVAHAHALIRTTSDGAFHGGVLSMRLYIPDGLMIDDPTPAHAITADTAAEDPCVAARVDSFYNTLEQVFGLGRGAVEYVPLPADYVDIDSGDKRTDAYRMTTGPDDGGPAVSFVWTDSLVIQGVQLWGQSAWAPGVPLPGHPLSGITVNISIPSFSAAADGMTMVHEAGHFMGLYHTSNQGNFFDPLDDTPECTDGTPIQSCPDAHNIMHFAFYGASGGVGLMASDQQRLVVQGSMLYRATPDQ